MKVTFTIVATVLFATVFVVINFYEYDLPWWIPEPVIYALYAAFVLFTTRSIPTTITATIFLFFVAYDGLNTITSQLSIETTVLGVVGMLGLGLSRVGSCEARRLCQKLNEEADTKRSREKQGLRDVAEANSAISGFMAGLDAATIKQMDELASRARSLARRGISKLRR